MSLSASNCLTVKQLIDKLRSMPQDARVGFPNMEIDQIESVVEVKLVRFSYKGPEVHLG